MINFDALPSSVSSNNVIPEGVYTAEIATAEMKTPKDTNKPDYLNLGLDIYDENHKRLGRIFDIMTESESEYMLFKIKCFCIAIGFIPKGTFELKDLTKICKNKKVKVTLSVGKDNNDNDKTQVNIFKNPYAPCEDTFMNIPESCASEVPFSESETAAESEY